MCLYVFENSEYSSNFAVTLYCYYSWILWEYIGALFTASPPAKDKWAPEKCINTVACICFKNKPLQQLHSCEPSQRANKMFLNSGDLWFKTDGVYPAGQVFVALTPGNAWSELCLCQRPWKQRNMHLSCFSGLVMETLTIHCMHFPPFPTFVHSQKCIFGFIG